MPTTTTVPTTAPATIPPTGNDRGDEVAGGTIDFCIRITRFQQVKTVVELDIVIELEDGLGVVDVGVYGMAVAGTKNLILT